MMDIFENKNIKPMLIDNMSDAFDSPDYIFELKLDGVRCLAFLSKDKTVLTNKRNLIVTRIYPELSSIHNQVKGECILDGELIVINNGKPDFSEIQRRALMSNKTKIEFSASKLPVSYAAFDILYLDGKGLTDLPLLKRKEILNNTVVENERLALSRFIEAEGTTFYNLAEKENLEGIVAKKKDSKYYINKTTKDWIKIKNLQDDDFVVCGYILKDKGVTSIILGQYLNNKLVYKGHVTLGVSSQDFNVISHTKKIETPEFLQIPKGNEGAIWVEPKLVCTVKYMAKTKTGSLRQPVFKGLRNDKSPKDCIVKN